jgi:hypothetical protein
MTGRRVADARERQRASTASVGGASRSAATRRRVFDALYSGAAEKRNTIPILGFMGENGHGKTANMVRDCLGPMRDGRPILSTCVILDPSTGEPYGNFELLQHWDQLMNFRDGVLLLDEIAGIADARSSGMPEAVRARFAKFRKHGVLVRYSAPSWENADKRVREITQGIVICRGYMPKAPVDENGIETSMWKQNRLFSARTVSALGRSAMTDTQMRKARALSLEYWWGPDSQAFDAYDTLDPTSTVSSLCVRSGLPVRQQFCTEKHDHTSHGPAFETVGS